MSLNFLKRAYRAIVLNHPVPTLVFILLLTLFFAAFIPQFRLDASSDSLLLEGDESLKYYREIKERYGSDDFLVVTYTPQGDLFARDTLADLKKLRDKLKNLERVNSVTSILDVPLVNSPPVTVDEFKKTIQTLTSPETDKALALEELSTSPLYSDLIISKDGGTTAILVTLEKNDTWREPLKERNSLRKKESEHSLSEGEEDRLARVEREYVRLSEKLQKQQHQDIENIRAILEQHKDKARIHLGGVTMITVDSINFVKNDLETFGLAVICLIIILLTIFFRRPRWVLLPILNCLTVGVIMVGFLGFAGWPVTIVSSNFISLLLIFTLSFSVHQVVRYLEYQDKNPKADQKTIVKESTLKIITPCLFMVITTIVAFGSLVVSDIRPVIDFGLMMSVGLGFSFLISFTLFPSLLMCLKPSEPHKHRDITGRITEFFAASIKRYSRTILIIFVFVILFIGYGASFLTVENRFVDYYKESTEIHQGMKTIDQTLGGTTPLDIIIDAPDDFLEGYKEARQNFIEERQEDRDINIPYTPHIINGYWIVQPRDKLKNIHHYLETLPEIGKVLSFHTTMEMANSIDPEASNTIALATIESDLPKNVRDMLFDSYISSDGNQIRLNARIHESDKTLKRNDLLQKINNHLINEMGIEETRVHLTGMLVLYNNVLQTLFDSQIKTIWTVFITIFVMFTILFRSPYIAAVAFLPNVAITLLVLGIMGWFGIPLDIMTITIAAICTGSADDNTIHYVHRFMAEYKKHGDYWKAVKGSHKSIGRAMYYTSVTIMLGFSILVFSNFVPTIYFGLLTAFAMLMALLANLVLLPLLLTVFKPFKV